MGMRGTGNRGENPLSDVGVIESDSLFGVFPSDFTFLVEYGNVDRVRMACESTKARVSRVDLKLSSVHVICTTKTDAHSVYFDLMNMDLFGVGDDVGVGVDASKSKIALLTSDTNKTDLARISSDWYNGTVKVLVSTSNGLVGNESPYCGAVVVVGALFNLFA